MSVHLEQVASVLRRAVQELLVRGLNDPRIRGMVSVTRVEVSPDISQALVYVSVLPEDVQATTVHGLKAATGHIQKHLAQTLPFKRLPKLVWKVDDTLKRHAAMMQTIQQAAERAGGPAPQQTEATGEQAGDSGGTAW